MINSLTGSKIEEFSPIFRDLKQKSKDPSENKRRSNNKTQLKHNKNFRRADNL